MVKISDNRGLSAVIFAPRLVGDVDLGGANQGQKWDPYILAHLPVPVASLMVAHSSSAPEKGGGELWANVHVANR